MMRSLSQQQQQQSTKLLHPSTMNQHHNNNVNSSNNSTDNKRRSTTGRSTSRYMIAVPSHNRIFYFILFIGVTTTIVLWIMTTTLNTNKYNNNNNPSQQHLRLIQERSVQLVLPVGFDTIYERSQNHRNQCHIRFQEGNVQQQVPVVPLSSQIFDERSELPFLNDTVASLPAFGIIQQLEEYAKSSKGTNEIWPTCVLPPTTECSEQHLTVVFMAYNPDRLGITLRQIRSMFNPTEFHDLIQEIIIVWNGPRHVNESTSGQQLLQYITQDTEEQLQKQIENHNEDTYQPPSPRIKIVYPLLMGFPNDLMNRYHPNVLNLSDKATKAILYYDDDGPFYSYDAILSGFELWKRHANVQVGAMSRRLIYSPYQQQQYEHIMEHVTKYEPTDTEFISHCAYNPNHNSNDKNEKKEDTSQNKRHLQEEEIHPLTDEVEYEFHYFANYDANMVLPSGSFLHVNYLCYLWHPIFEPIREFVLNHPVHPDDMTVSVLISQLSGKAPRVYSRKINKKSKRQRRQLREEQEEDNDDEDKDENDDNAEQMEHGLIPLSEQQRHRRLLFNINWDAGSGMNDMKQYWANLRKEAINSLLRYFGTINSGSIGWCSTTSSYYRNPYPKQPKKKSIDGRCDPIMAQIGMLPWMNEDHTPKTTCP